MLPPLIVVFNTGIQTGNISFIVFNITKIPATVAISYDKRFIFLLFVFDFFVFRFFTTTPPLLYLKYSKERISYITNFAPFTSQNNHLFYFLIFPTSSYGSCLNLSYSLIYLIKSFVFSLSKSHFFVSLLQYR